MIEQNVIKLGNVSFSNAKKMTLIAGPCQMETRDHAMMMAENLVKIAQKHGVDFVYKSSFDKANRTSLAGKRGIGLENSLEVFGEIKKTFGCPTLTDVHGEEQCRILADSGVIDVLQIPAFLCRQTDLLVAAAKTNLVINVKKGQFLAPWDMENVKNKIVQSGNEKVILTERGTCFGYNNLVTDIRSLEIMAETGCPVVFDATHSVQQPGGLGGASGGQRKFVRTLARAALTVPIAGVFLETHQDPDHAPSDGPCMVRLSDMDKLIGELVLIDSLNKN